MMEIVGAAKRKMIELNRWLVLKLKQYGVIPN
jgi:hypothetical protein